MMDQATQDRILELWAEGKTTRIIGEEVGVTKNSVCGLLKRLRDKGHPVPQRIYKFEAKKPVNKKIAQLKKVTRLKAIPKKPEPKGTPVAVVPPPPKRKVNIGKVKFIDLQPDSCRYIVSGKRAEEFLFCGAPKTRRAYCDEHAKLCYISVQRENKPRPTFMLQRMPGEK